MNLTAKTTELNRVPVFTAESETRHNIWFSVLVGASFLVHSFIAYAQRPFTTTAALELIFGSINFTAIVLLFYGISRLYYTRQYIFLAVSSALAIALAVILSGKVTALMITAGWCAVLSTPIVCAHLTQKNYSPIRIYGWSLLVLVLFSSMQLFPLWTKMIIGAGEAFKLISKDLTTALIGAGYSQSAADSMMAQFEIFYQSFVRLMPSITILAVMMQFSLGFYFYMRWLKRFGNTSISIPSFLHWKMPFAATPVLLIAVIMRLTGNEMLTLFADNLILILAVYYSITGLSVLEFFMKKFYVSTMGRIIIYFLLMVSHVIGFALLALVGFVDSFYDWRRKYPLPIDIKTS